MTHTTRTKLTTAFIALSLCMTWFWFTRASANGNRNNSLTLFVFVADSHIQNHYDQLMDVWKPRIGGNWIAGRLADAFAHDGSLSEGAYQNVFGAYNAGWLLLIFGVLICLADNPLFVIPLVFAGMCYSLTPPDDVTIYPWDMPSVFFFTLSFLLWQRRNFGWMLTTIIVGTAFKETCAVTALLYFFAPLDWKKKIGYFGSAFAVCLLLKLWITQAMMGHMQICTATFTKSGNDSGFSLLTLKQNLQDFFGLYGAIFIGVNAGTFIVALLLPARTLAEKGIKTVLVVFFIGQSFAGAYRELREFMDVLPMSVLYLNRIVQNWRTGVVGPGVLPPPQS